MVVCLNWKCLEPTLPHMACRFVVGVVTSSMGHLHPLHPGAQVTVGMGSDHQVKMVWHQTKSQDIDINYVPLSAPTAFTAHSRSFVRLARSLITRFHRFRLRRVLLTQKDGEHDIERDHKILRLPGLKGH